MHKSSDSLCKSYGNTDVDRLRAAPRAVGTSWLIILLLIVAVAAPRLFGAVPGEAAEMAQAAKQTIHVIKHHLPGLGAPGLRDGGG
jgi:hypothetical protein